MAQPEFIYQLKVTLDGISPSIWRRIQVSEKSTLFELHKILQIVMPWYGHHLHEFIIDDQYYTDMTTTEDWDTENKDELDFNLKSLKLKTGSKFKYVYDFGDSWRHTILVEEIFPAQKDVNYPCCIKGKNAAPPDDIGGPWRYETFLEAIKDPNHEEYQFFSEWIDMEFDPTEFNLDEVNQLLFQYAYKNWPLDVEFPYLYWMSNEDFLDFQKLEKILKKPVTGFNRETALVKNANVFLRYLKENNVIGTKSKGNLPRKAIYGIAGGFANMPEYIKEPEKAEIKILNEEEIPELVFTHLLLQGAGLISGGRDLQWQLTTAGEAFLSASTERQFLILFEAWWFRINWLTVAFYNVFGKLLPEGFVESVIVIFMKMGTTIEIDYHNFFTYLAELVQFEYILEEDEWVKQQIKSDIESFLIDPLTEFGVVNPKFDIDEKSPIPIPILKSFKVTKLGYEIFKNIVYQLEKSSHNLEV